MRIITVKVDDELFNEIEKTWPKYARSRSEFIRQALVKYLEELNSRKTGRIAVLV